MKAAWDPVKLHVSWGDPPPCPSTLRMPSGRRYMVTGVCGRTVHAIVLPPSEPDEPPVIEWRWAKRKRRALR